MNRAKVAAQKAAKKATLAEDVAKWETNFKAEFEKRYDAMRKVVDKTGHRLLKCFEDFLDENISPDVKDIRLSEFIYDGESSAKVHIVNDGRSEMAMEVDVDEDVQQGQHQVVPRDETCQKCKEGPFSTVKRRPLEKMTGIMANTPAGPVRLPSVITPKVRNGSEVHFRELRPEEVAFSLYGTPVVAQATNSEANTAMELMQLMKIDDNELSPQTRDVMRGMRNIVNRLQQK